MPKAAITVVTEYPMAAAGSAAQTVHVDQPPDLLARLTRLPAACALDQDVAPYNTFLCRLFPAEPVRLACDLLAAGIESPAIIALACESPTRLAVSDGEPVLRQLLTKLQIEPLNEYQAAWITARELAREIEYGQLDPATGGHLLYGLGRACGEPEEMRSLHDTLDDWEQTPPQDQDLGRLGGTMRTIARAVIQAAPGYPVDHSHFRSDSTGIPTVLIPDSARASTPCPTPTKPPSQHSPKCAADRRTDGR
jgi:hypothetical protein